MHGASHVLFLKEELRRVSRRGGQTLNGVASLLEQPIDGFLQDTLFDTQRLCEPGAGLFVRGCLGSDQLEVAEGDGVQDDSHLAPRLQDLGKGLEDLAPDHRVEGIPVEGQQGDAPLTNPLELGLDLAHRSTSIAVDDTEVEPVLGELVGGGQPETAGTPQDQSPLIGLEAFRRHFHPDPSIGGMQDGARISGSCAGCGPGQEAEAFAAAEDDHDVARLEPACSWTSSRLRSAPPHWLTTSMNSVTLGCRSCWAIKRPPCR